MSFRILLILLLFYYFGCILCYYRRNGYDTVSFNNAIDRSNIELKLNVPQIVYDLPLLSKFQNDFFSLNCGIKGNPVPTIKWFFNRINSNRFNGFTQIGDSNGYTINSDGELQFSKDSPMASAYYYCSATNAFGTVYSRKSEVHKIFWSTKEQITYETSEIEPYGKAVIECAIKPDILTGDYIVKEWLIKFNDGPPSSITKTEGRYSVITVTKVPQLHIRNVTKDDFSQMQVRCVLENKYLSRITEDRKQWTRPNEFILFYITDLKYDKCRGREVFVARGSDVELPWCSHPSTPVIVWFKSNSSSLQRGSPISLSSWKYKMISGKYGNLMIKSVDVSDEGYYFVKRDNKTLVDYSPFQVKVTIKIGIDVSPAVHSVRFGDSGMKFRCVITGYPVTDIFWLHNGVNVITGAYKTTSVDVTTTQSLLTIDHVTTDSAGVYQCVAESRNVADNRLLDFALKAAAVVITEMSPRLVGQTPPVPGTEPYATATMDSAHKVVNIQCSFNAIPNATIQWFLDDSPILLETVIALKITTKEPYTKIATLQIDFNQLNSIGDKWRYGGLYVARATNNYGTAECKTLVFVEGVFMIRDQKTITLKHGQQWTMKCYVISSDRPEITWYKIQDGKRIHFPDTHREIEALYKREIFIDDVVKKTHDASYECTAMLGPHKVTSIINVRVVMPPQDITYVFPEEQRLETNTVFVLLCQPKPTLDLPWYSWWEFQPDSSKSISMPLSEHQSIEGLSVSWRQTSDSKSDYPPVPPGVPGFLYNLTNIFSKISIQFHKNLHMSNLTCVVQNNAGIIRKSFRITIAVIEFDVEPPAEMNVTLGSAFILNCSSRPNKLETTTIWYSNKKEVPLYVSGTQSQMYRFSNGTLIVKNMTGQGHTHTFMCMINSNSTQSISKIVKISLQVPATILPMADNFDLVLHSSYNLVCPIYGDSNKLEMKWQRLIDGQWKSERNVIKIEDIGEKMTNLTIQFPRVMNDISGQYRCVARNIFSVREAQKTVIVEVVAVPGPVTLLYESIKKEARTVDLTWLEPTNNGNKPLTGYLVTWTIDNQESKQNVSKLDTRISGLRPNTLYKVTVRATNQVGLGEPVSVDVRTNQDSPGGTVLELTVEARSSTVLRLSWAPPDPLLQYGPILLYEVCHQRLSTDQFSVVDLNQLPWPHNRDSKSVPIPASNKKTQYICEAFNGTDRIYDDLPKFTGYAFRVSARNEIGIGPPAFVKARTMEDLPDKAPINVTYTGTSTNFINLQWNPPPQDAINGVIQGYRVMYFRPEHYGREKDGLVNNVSETRLRLEDLVPYSNYSIQVAVFNRKGPGPYSAPLIVATSQDTPSPPNIVRVLPYNDTCVLVVWTPPVAPNGPLSQYCVTVNATDRKKCIEAGTRHSYLKMKVCELIPGVEYVMKVTAHNNINHQSKPAISKRVRAGGGSDAVVSVGGNIVVTDKARVVLDCETLHGRPSWYHSPSMDTGYSMISPGSHDNYQQENNGSLVILSSTSATNGSYQCSLSNRDSIKYSVTVKVVTNGIPVRPEIYYHSASRHNIFISWRCAGSPRQDDPVSSFHVTLIIDDDSLSKKTYDVSPVTRTYNISGLTCGTRYKVELSASNNAGHSDSDKVEVRTQGSKPQWANSSRLVASVHTHSLCFRLAEFLAGDGCPAERFLVEVTPSTGHQYNFSGNQRLEQCTMVENLHPDTEYRYTVWALNHAGNSSTSGHQRTVAARPTVPTVVKTHQDSHWNLFYEPKLYIIVGVILLAVLVLAAVTLYCSRRSYSHQMLPPQKVNNILHHGLHQQQSPPFTTMMQPSAVTATPSMSHRNRRLPDPPCNTYDSGITAIAAAVAAAAKNNTEDDDDLKPYATYAPLHMESMSGNSRSQSGPGGKKTLVQESTAYNAGSQAHSYQYPDMVGNGNQQQQQQPDMHANNVQAGPAESYENTAKQPLLSHGHRQMYSKGYSVGGEVRGPLLPGTVQQQRPSESMCQEPYRPGGSTWSNTTGSSTKELTQLFHHNLGGDLTLGLREQDEDNCSTIRPMNHSTLTGNPIRMMQTTEDPQDSYFESGSSCDDPGIREFTQERFRGQAVEPRFTSHVPHHFARQSSSASSTYDSVDGPPHRPSIPFNEAPRFVRQETLAEEEESSNYQNKFVIV